jgi:hypothetical protein
VKSETKETRGFFSYNSTLLVFFKSVILAALLLTGCSGNPPSITDVRWRLMAFHDTQNDKKGEYLSLAILAADDDGQDDFESISIVNDDKELYWQALTEEWIVRQVRQQSWIVLEKILAPGDSLPRGRYRIIIRDFAGSQAESSFNITASQELPQNFPSLIYSEGQRGSLTLETSQNESILMVRSEAGILLGSVVLKKGFNPREPIIANVQKRTQARQLYLYEQGASNRHSLFAGPWSAEDYLFSSR